MILLLVVLGLLFWVAALFFQLDHSRKIENCAAFNSYGEALQFVTDNPSYAKRLDKNHDGRPCETYPYGNI